MTVTPEVLTVAKALAAVDGVDFDAGGYSLLAYGGREIDQGPTQSLYVKRALACMEALLTPSEGMIEDGATAIEVSNYTGDMALVSYRAMLLRAMGRDGT